MRVVPDTNLLERNSFLITTFTIQRKLGVMPTFHNLEVYPCGCIVNSNQGVQVYEPCGLHELPEKEGE